MPDWTDDLKQWDEALAEFDEDLPAFGDEEPDLDDPTQDKHKGLDADLSFRFTPRTRSYADLLQVKTARDHITRLPEPGESIHGVVSGRYPLFAVVPSIIELSGQSIDQLHLVTLSYGKDNAADLVELLDAGRIGRVWVMVSHYFANANPHLYDPLSAALKKRGHRMLGLRTHAKIILAKLRDGTRYVVESSANLRSCKNIEQFVFTRDDGLHAFHLRWIQGLFDAASELTE